MNELNDTQKAKVQRFVIDPVTSEAVYSVLLRSFLKKRTDEDTTMKAARFIATELLVEGWKELQKYRVQTEKNGSTIEQVGM